MAGKNGNEKEIGEKRYVSHHYYVNFIQNGALYIGDPTCNRAYITRKKT
jgi:hypothetical protein